MKKVIIILGFLLISMLGFSQNTDEKNVKISMGLHACYQIKQTPEGCYEIIAAPSIELFDLYYRKKSESEYKKYEGDKNINDFLLELCKKEEEYEFMIMEKIM